LEAGGMVRAGPVHYNTLQEIERFGEALKKLLPKAVKTRDQPFQLVLYF